VDFLETDWSLGATGLDNNGVIKMSEKEDYVKKPAESVQELAEFMHNEYLKLAKMHGWVVQDQTDTKFEDLPAVNRVVMYLLAVRVLGWFVGLYMDGE
jgi:hypothetical protein